MTRDEGLRTARDGDRRGNQDAPGLHHQAGGGAARSGGVQQQQRPLCTEVSEVELDQPCPPDRSEVATLAEVYFGSREPDDITKWVYDKYEQRRVPGKHRSGVVATVGGCYLFWSFDGPDALAAQIVEAAKVHYGGGRVMTDGIRGAREAQRACDAAAAMNNHTRVPGPSGHVQEGM